MWWILWLSAVIAAGAAYAYMPTLWRLHKAKVEAAALKEDNERLRSQVDDLRSRNKFLQGVTDGAVAVTAYVAASQGGRIEIPRAVMKKRWVLTRRDDEETGALVFMAEEVEH